MTAAAILRFVEQLGALKHLPRTGWVMRGIGDAESIADHGFRVTHLAMLLADQTRREGERIDTEKVLRMAILHEIGEALLGDIPRNEGSPVSAALKSEIEEKAVRSLTGPLEAAGEVYRELWLEFEHGDSGEARLVRAADKLEMLIQAREYEKIGYRCLEDFWRHRGSRTVIDTVTMAGEIAALLDGSRAGA